MMRLSVELRLNLSSRVPALVLRLSVESWHTLPYVDAQRIFQF